MEEGRTGNGFRSSIRFSSFFFFDAISNKLSPCVKMLIFSFPLICLIFSVGDTYISNIDTKSVVTSGQTDLFQTFEYIYLEDFIVWAIPYSRNYWGVGGGRVVWKKPTISINWTERSFQGANCRRKIKTFNSISKVREKNDSTSA